MLHMISRPKATTFVVPLSVSLLNFVNISLLQQFVVAVVCCWSSPWTFSQMFTLLVLPISIGHNLVGQQASTLIAAPTGSCPAIDNFARL